MLPLHLILAPCFPHYICFPCIKPWHPASLTTYASPASNPGTLLPSLHMLPLHQILAPCFPDYICFPCIKSWHPASLTTYASPASNPGTLLPSLHMLPLHQILAPCFPHYICFPCIKSWHPASLTTYASPASNHGTLLPSATYASPASNPGTLLPSLQLHMLPLHQILAPCFPHYICFPCIKSWHPASLTTATYASPASNPGTLLPSLQLHMLPLHQILAPCFPHYSYICFPCIKSWHPASLTTATYASPASNPGTLLPSLHMLPLHQILAPCFPRLQLHMLPLHHILAHCFPHYSYICFPCIKSWLHASLTTATYASPASNPGTLLPSLQLHMLPLHHILAPCFPHYSYICFPCIKSCHTASLTTYASSASNPGTLLPSLHICFPCIKTWHPASLSYICFPCIKSWHPASLTTYASPASNHGTLLPSLHMLPLHQILAPCSLTTYASPASNHGTLLPSLHMLPLHQILAPCFPHYICFPCIKTWHPASLSYIYLCSPAPNPGTLLL